MAFNFDSLWSFYTKACAAAGILTFLEPEKRTMFLKVYQTLCQFSFFVFVFSILYTLATQYSDFVVVIIASAGLVIFFAVKSGTILLLENYDKFMVVIQWCRTIHQNEEYFDPIVRQYAQNHFDMVGQKSMKIMKIFTNLLVFDGFACTILFTTLAYLLPSDMLLEKWHPPFPFDVPFHDQATWKSFSINLLIQTLGIVNGTLLGNVVMCIFCVIFIHLLAYLDVVLAAVKSFHDVLNITYYYRNGLFENTRNRELLEILNTIQGDTDDSESEIDEFYVYIKLIVDMCSEFHSIMATFSDLSSLIFLIWEFTSLFTTFISGIILLLERQHFVLSLGVLMGNIFFFAVCMVNSMIQEKISKINVALYSLPWYFMKPSERRTLLLAKHVVDVNVGFTAGGIHELNLEQFKLVTETAVSNCMVLKTLAEQ